MRKLLYAVVFIAAANSSAAVSQTSMLPPSVERQMDIEALRKQPKTLDPDAYQAAVKKIALASYNSRRNLNLFSYGVEISNRNDFFIKDVTMKCGFYGQSGTMISGREVVAYVLVRPSSSQTVAELATEFVPAQAISHLCTATGFALLALP